MRGIAALANFPKVRRVGYSDHTRSVLTGALAVAAGADGLIMEVHNCPEKALSDGAQSLRPEKFAKLVAELRRIAEAVDRTV